MPHKLKDKMMHLLHGLDESIYQYKQIIAECTAAGYISKSEAEARLKAYQGSLTQACQIVSDEPGQLMVHPQQRQELKEEFKRIEWRLQLHGEEQTEKNETDAIVAYLNHKRKQTMEQLENSMEIARSLFSSAGDIQQAADTFIQIKATEQLSKETRTLKLPCWYWGKKPVHYDRDLVDEIERQTNCQATIFQRMPQGFIRVSTNIRNLNGRRAVGTFIPNESKVVQTVLRGESFRGSAFVLNNWYLSIYEPFYLDGEVAGILYVGRREALELAPARALSEKKVEKIFRQLQDKGAFQAELDDLGTGKLIQALSNLPDHATHPVINMGLKEIAAMLLKQQERKSAPQREHTAEPELDFIINYIQENLAEDISIDLLAERTYMSKASFYRYFKTKFNTTPKAFINQERLRQACQIMQKNSNLSIQEICTQVGFKSTSYFIKLFRDYYGLTPKQYQMQRGSEEDVVL